MPFGGGLFIAKEQTDAWATGNLDLAVWDRSFQEHYTVVALDGKIIIGFGDIDKNGYLDRLFVHAEYQGQGIASALCGRLEQAVRGEITTHASITAKPFLKSEATELSGGSRWSGGECS